MADSIPGTKVVEVAPPAPPPTIELPPVAVTVIGTKSDAIPADGTVATVASAQAPNLLVTTVTPFIAIAIRFANVYIGLVIGLLGTAMTSNAITAPDFLHLLLKCMGLAVGGSVVLLLKDIGTVLSGLEKTHPLATGSI